MNPRRLIEETCDPTEALLLRSVKAEQLSGPQRRRILASFGAVSAGTGTAPGDTLSPESGSPIAGASQGGTALIGKVSLLHAVSLKWVGLGALCLIPVAVVMARHRAPPSAEGSAFAVQAAPHAVPSMVNAAGEEAMEPREAMTFSNPVAPQQATRKTQANVPAPSSLSREVAALKEVRRALVQQDAASAFRALDRYDRRFARGRLGPEAMALRVEALAMQGDLAAANALAARLESLHPENPYRARLRSILSAAANP